MTPVRKPKFCVECKTLELFCQDFYEKIINLNSMKLFYLMENLQHNDQFML